MCPSHPFNEARRHMSEHVVEAEVVEPEPGESLVSTAAPTTLFRTEDPLEVLTRAKAVADALAPVIRQAGLVSTISGKDHLRVEAWQTLGAQVGVTPIIVSTRRIEKGWEARCEARTLDGRVVGAADSMCLTSEERWKDSADFEVRSMAQTRAMSRALASVLRFIPTLAGFSGTPAEEMDRQQGGGGGPKPASEKQVGFLMGLCRKSGSVEPDLSLIEAYAAVNLTGGKQGSCSKVIDKLNGVEAKDTLAKLTKAAKEWDEEPAEPDVPADTEGLPGYD